MPASTRIRTGERWPDLVSHAPRVEEAVAARSDELVGADVAAVPVQPPLVHSAAGGQPGSTRGDGLLVLAHIVHPRRQVRQLHAQCCGCSARSLSEGDSWRSASLY